MDNKENPTAFPFTEKVTTQSGLSSYDEDVHHPGMTLRDYFAAKAMHAMYSNMAILKHADKNDPHGDIAMDAYVVADFMLKARKKSGDK